jgi:epoxyqueuosine reductase
MMSPQKNSETIKLIAKQLGFAFCGISTAQFLEKEAPRLEAFLKQQYHGKMSYLENHFDKRLDPRLLLDGAKTVVSLMVNYFPSTVVKTTELKIAKYAYGEDYHEVVKEKCKQMIEQIQAQIGAVNARSFVDSGPVMERAWAEKSGLGWIGKHGLIINPQKGSFFFLADIILDLECQEDGPIKDYCGTCNKCVEACPTEAILPNKTLNASKCISYLTIELKEEIPTSFAGKMDNWIFGCDICQDVCPWNRFSTPHEEARFEPIKVILNNDEKDWMQMEEEVFKQVFKKSPIKRTKLNGIKRNVTFIKNKINE